MGDIVDGVCRTAHCPVVVVNLGRDVDSNLGRILVPIKDLSASAREQFELALRVINSAEEDQRVRITLLHVHDPASAARTVIGWSSSSSVGDRRDPGRTVPHRDRAGPGIDGPFIVSAVSTIW